MPADHDDAWDCGPGHARTITDGLLPAPLHRDATHTIADGLLAPLPSGAQGECSDAKEKPVKTVRRRTANKVRKTLK